MTPTMFNDKMTNFDLTKIQLRERKHFQALQLRRIQDRGNVFHKITHKKYAQNIWIKKLSILKQINDRGKAQALHFLPPQHSSYRKKLRKSKTLIEKLDLLWVELLERITFTHQKQTLEFICDIYLRLNLLK